MNPFDQFDPPASAPAAANPFDQFDAPSGAPPLTVTPAPPQPGWWDTAKDVAQSAATGVEKGAIAVAGAPANIDRAGRNAMAWALDKVLPQPAQRSDAAPPDVASYLGSDGITKGVEALAGPMYQPKTTAGHYAEKVGEFVPGAAIGGGSMVRTAVLPGLGDEAGGQLTKGTAAEPFARIAGSMAAPGLLSLGERAVTPFPISPERQTMVNTLQSEGVPLTAGQVTGSKPLQFMESALGQTFGGGGRAAQIAEDQGRAFTGAAMRRMGSTADNAGPDAFGAARNALGQQFDALSARNTMRVDPQLGQDLGQVIREYQNVLPSERHQQVGNIISDVMATPNGQITGAAYQDARSRLSRASDSYRNSDPAFAGALRGIRDGLDNAMTRSVSPEDAQAWSDVRRQWAAGKVIEKAATGAGENAAQGIISAPALRNAVASQNRTAYAQGHGDLAPLARAGEAVMRPLPDSGTAGRTNALQLAHLLATGGAGVAGGMEGAITAAAAPAAMARVLMSRPAQGYLSNQLLAARQHDPRELARILMGETVATSLPGQSQQSR